MDMHNEIVADFSEWARGFNSEFTKKTDLYRRLGRPDHHGRR